ncbi:MAG: hypothetical protein QG582_1065, partial [Candidatus Thermoplasmatota archaeon]|nr:hypothetical protein [Candidatus Thermoplasmatota archaeon]
SSSRANLITEPNELHSGKSHTTIRTTER